LLRCCAGSTSHTHLFPLPHTANTGSLRTCGSSRFVEHTAGLRFGSTRLNVRYGGCFTHAVYHYTRSVSLTYHTPHTPRLPALHVYAHTHRTHTSRFATRSPLHLTVYLPVFSCGLVALVRPSFVCLDTLLLRFTRGLRFGSHTHLRFTLCSLSFPSLFLASLVYHALRTSRFTHLGWFPVYMVYIWVCRGLPRSFCLPRCMVLFTWLCTRHALPLIPVETGLPFIFPFVPFALFTFTFFVYRCSCGVTSRLGHVVVCSLPVVAGFTLHPVISHGCLSCGLYSYPRSFVAPSRLLCRCRLRLFVCYFSRLRLFGGCHTLPDDLPVAFITRIHSCGSLVCRAPLRCRYFDCSLFVLPSHFTCFYFACFCAPVTSPISFFGLPDGLRLLPPSSRLNIFCVVRLICCARPLTYVCPFGYRCRSFVRLFPTVFGWLVGWFIIFVYRVDILAFWFTHTLPLHVHFVYTFRWFRCPMRVARGLVFFCTLHLGHTNSSIGVPAVYPTHLLLFVFGCTAFVVPLHSPRTFHIYTHPTQVYVRTLRVGSPHVVLHRFILCCLPFVAFARLPPLARCYGYDLSVYRSPFPIAFLRFTTRVYRPRSPFPTHAPRLRLHYPPFFTRTAPRFVLYVPARLTIVPVWWLRTGCSPRFVPCSGWLFHTARLRTCSCAFGFRIYAHYSLSHPVPHLTHHGLHTFCTCLPFRSPFVLRSFTGYVRYALD